MNWVVHLIACTMGCRIRADRLVYKKLYSYHNEEKYICKKLHHHSLLEQIFFSLFIFFVLLLNSNQFSNSKCTKDIWFFPLRKLPVTALLTFKTNESVWEINFGGSHYTLYKGACWHVTYETPSCHKYISTNAEGERHDNMC